MRPNLLKTRLFHLQTVEFSFLSSELLQLTKPGTGAMVTKNSVPIFPEELIVKEGCVRKTNSLDEIQSFTNLNDVTCPICLDFPHNSVLLQCSSYEKGCQAFVCDTDHLHSNCLERFKLANGMSPNPKTANTSDIQPVTDSESQIKPACPLCRGEVTGWVVVDKARMQLDEKKRYCEEGKCKFSGTYKELQKHAKIEHPHAFPSKIDPARLLDWENFQQSSEIIDVLTTIHSEVPHGVVLGDYVIEYGDDNSGDDFDDFNQGEGNWWTSCMLYKVFVRASRNRRRARVGGSRRGNRQLGYDISNSDEGSVSSVENVDFRVDRIDDEFVSSARGRAGQHSSRRRRSRFYDHQE